MVTGSEQTPVTVIKRDEQGRFLRGTQGGPGRLPERSIALRDALLAEIQPAEVAALGRKLFDLALSGDLKATQILLDKLIPRGQGGGTSIAIVNQTDGRTLATTILERMEQERSAPQDGEM